LEFKAKLCAAVGVQSEALCGGWSSKRSFAWQLEFKAKLCAAVGVQSEALRGSWSSKRSFARQLEFKAKLCAAKQSFALNSNEYVL
jgi:hypothetical protein